MPRNPVWSSYLTVLLLVPVLLAAGGCGESSPPPPEVHPVTGVVTLDGSPVTSGVVNFIGTGDAGYAASAPLSAEGRYQVVTEYGDGLPDGSYQVSVEPPADALMEADSNPGQSLPEFAVPEKYRSPATSGLTVEVAGEAKTFEIDLLSR